MQPLVVNEIIVFKAHKAENSHCEKCVFKRRRRKIEKQEEDKYFRFSTIAQVRNNDNEQTTIAIFQFQLENEIVSNVCKGSVEWQKASAIITEKSVINFREEREILLFFQFIWKIFIDLKTVSNFHEKIIFVFAK
jgi:hypothetical protein